METLDIQSIVDEIPWRYNVPNTIQDLMVLKPNDSKSMTILFCKGSEGEVFFGYPSMLWAFREELEMVTQDVSIHLQ